MCDTSRFAYTRWSIPRCATWFRGSQAIGQFWGACGAVIARYWGCSW